MSQAFLEGILSKSWNAFIAANYLKIKKKRIVLGKKIKEKLQNSSASFMK